MNREDNVRFFKKVNRLCQFCIHDCKQSAYLEILACPQYETKEGEKGYKNKKAFGVIHQTRMNNKLSKTGNIDAK